MRSKLIFAARGEIKNRYMLCHAAAKVTRCLHYCSSSTRDAISDALVRIAREPCLCEESGTKIDRERVVPTASRPPAIAA